MTSRWIPLEEFRRTRGLESASREGGEKMQKKCKQCGGPVKHPKYDLCHQCSQEGKRVGLPQDYLASGYFDETGILREELITTHARNIAECFGHWGLKKHQLRRFYHHAKECQNRCIHGTDYKEVYIDLKKMLYFAVQAESRSEAKVPSEFRKFIELNLSQLEPDDPKPFFKGFLPHFEAVVGFSERYLRQ